MWALPPPPPPPASPPAAVADPDDRPDDQPDDLQDDQPDNDLEDLLVGRTIRPSLSLEDRIAIAKLLRYPNYEQRPIAPLDLQPTVWAAFLYGRERPKAIGRRQWYRWKNGLTAPWVKNLAELCPVLGVSEKQMMTDLGWGDVPRYIRPSQQSSAPYDPSSEPYMEDPWPTIPKCRNFQDLCEWIEYVKGLILLNSKIKKAAAEGKEYKSPSSQARSRRRKIRLQIVQERLRSEREIPRKADGSVDMKKLHVPHERLFKTRADLANDQHKHEAACERAADDLYREYTEYGNQLYREATPERRAEMAERRERVAKMRAERERQKQQRSAELTEAQRVANERTNAILKRIHEESARRLEEANKEDNGLDARDVLDARIRALSNPRGK